MFSYLELVELPNGDIVLQRSDDEGEPLVVISFSAEARQYLAVSPMEVARAMVQAGIQTASGEEALSVEEEFEQEELSDSASLEGKTLH